jgi:chitinase
MSIPRPLVEAYWLGYVGSHANNGPGLDLDEVPSQTPVDVVKIAFYNLYPANMITTCFGMSEKHGWGYTAEGIKKLQAAGIKVQASLIGTPDPVVSWDDIPDVNAFAANVKQLLIDDLGCDGIDLDMDGGAPSDDFAVVPALRNALGAKGGDKSLLSCVVYQPDQDLAWLKNVGSDFDWITTMAYWDQFPDQQQLFQQYAAVVGRENVVVGVACYANEGQNTSPQTVTEVAQWETQQGAGATGGMMLWNLSGGPLSGEYFKNIEQNLTIWKPPQP